MNNPSLREKLETITWQFTEPGTKHLSDLNDQLEQLLNSELQSQAKKHESEKAEAVKEALLSEWEQIDGNEGADAHYWDYREIDGVTKKIKLSPIDRMEELSGGAKDE